MGRTKTNAIGLERGDYSYNDSTLCPGCGHNSISNQIMAVAFEESLDQHHIIKMSGIGCSSKSPAYFLGRSHAFNSVHGRMPSVTTGAVMANHTLHALAVSGDGDTGNIGFGQFKHLMRRNLPMVYIVENNGVYGLTKGQFSATADKGQKTKYAGHNPFSPIDLCLEALIGGATFIARSFSGDAKQVRTLLKLAMSHRGTALIDIISPCVTFNDRDDSTKSYHWGKTHRDILNEIGFVQTFDEIAVEYDEGEVQPVQMHDGTWITLKKLTADHDPTNKESAFRVLNEAHSTQQIVTGLIYINTDQPTVVDIENMTDEPLVHLPESRLRPSQAMLEDAMSSLFAAN
ncbi:MAG: 2-oxoacid:ferredoxin oxidoreductase subunit beta [Anaerolineales bacterium]|nr:2-oxoacid:ferredoxin oxidoreductase subunit beta [Anaerolineales bacterium]